MNEKLLMETAMLAGKIMLCSGAETYRVEETINYILKSANVGKTEAFVMPTGIIATLDNPETETITVLKRIENRNTDLNKVVLTNEVSRKLCGGEISLEEAYKQLQTIRQANKNYGKVKTFFAVIFVAAGFVALLGGSFTDILLASADGALLAFFMLLGEQVALNAIIQDIVSSIVIAIGAYMMRNYLSIPVNMDLIIIGTIMPIVPGVAITNAIRDTLNGDFISGGARALEAFLKAAAIAVGVGVGLAICGGVL